MDKFEPQTAVIIGGASGIGLAVARKLSAQGVTVMLADLPGDRLDEAAASIDSAKSFPCDVADYDQVEGLAAHAFEEFGHVDLVLNNAGIGGPNGKMWDVALNDARAHFDVNFWGIWNGCKAFAPRLAAQSSASAIYNTGSENSFFCAVPKSAAYIAAKHAVLGLTESLRGDLPDHVHGGLIIPGWVFTPLGPEQFMKLGMDVDDYAATIVPQIFARRRFVVSHGYNTVRIAERMDELAQSYAEYALPPDEDARHDVRLVMDQLRRDQAALD
jgi:NAD(P)-dependent dehydrogenase (short-subunit alcohol dehydrogenase family)